MPRLHGINLHPLELPPQQYAVAVLVAGRSLLLREYEILKVEAR